MMTTMHERWFRKFEGDPVLTLLGVWLSDGLLGYGSLPEAKREIMGRNKQYGATEYRNGVEYCDITGTTHRIFFVED